MVAQRERRPSPRYLDTLYPLPQWTATLEEFRRLHHLDIPGLSDLEISRELSRLWSRIVVEWPPLDDWTWRRRSALFAERDRRRRAPLDAPPGPPPSDDGGGFRPVRPAGRPR